MTSATSKTLGEPYDPLGVHMDDPYPFRARARRETPVFFSPKANAWVVTWPLNVPAAGYPEIPNFVQSAGEEHRWQRDAG